MGNHHSNNNSSIHIIKPILSKSNSGVDIQEKSPTTIVPVEKLAKVSAIKYI